MSTSGCGRCGKGQYLCPSDQVTCVNGSRGYASCPGMKGTHLDETLDVESRLDYLVAHTQLADKIAQLTNKAPEIPHLGIPSYNWLNDDQHGVARTTAHATVLPNGCGLGATFSKQTLHAAGRVVGQEARGLHNMFLHEDNNRGANCNGCGITAYAPNLNLVRDPRWGRGQETFGEDPYHMGRLVVSYVTGAQDNAPDANAGPDGKHMLIGMCCKHFAMYDLENIPTARFEFDANATSEDMWYTYMPAFQACIQEARATHVMCSYNSVNGIPTCGSKGLLTEILRDQWNWDGFVVSDYDAWANIFKTHHYVPTMEDAAALGINAGLDQEGGGTSAISTLVQAVTDGKVTKESVATAFRRLFRIRIRLGMLDDPTSMAYNKLNGSQAQSPEHMNITRTAALEGMTLLKNEKKALPLNAASFSKPGSLCVVGPQAKMAGLLMGNYAESAANGNWGTDILDAVTELVGNNASVAWSQGCPDPNCETTEGFAAAAAAAKTADAVIVTLGLWFNAHGDANEAEGHDRTAIELPGHQADLVAAVRAAVKPGTPVIGLLVHGGTLALGDAGDQLDAIISAWYPGLEGGHAIAQTLFGDYSPAGRTPVTWYTSTEVLPQPGEMNEATGGGVTYRFFKDYKASVVYPFGYGLSYTSFAYSGLSVNATRVAPCDAVGVTVTVANTGGVDSDEVVQVYAKTPDAASPFAPRVRLVAFERVFVPRGKSVTVSLAVTPDTHSTVVSNPSDPYKDTRQAAPGTLSLFVGGGQPDYYDGALAVNVTVQGAAVPLSQC